jgi:hypothetical protein
VFGNLQPLLVVLLGVLLAWTNHVSVDAVSSKTCNAIALGAITTVPPRAAPTASPVGCGGAARVCAATHTRPPVMATAMRPPVSR